MLKVFSRRLRLDKDELEVLSKFLVDIAKGILGVPLVIYLVSGFSLLVLAIMFMLDLVIVIALLVLALIIHRLTKRKLKNG